MFFMGTYTPKLDDKGRLFLPAKFRDRAGGGARGDAGAGELPRRLAPADFEQVADAAQRGADHAQAARDYIRMLLRGRRRGGARQAGPDHASRRLREYAALSRDVVVIGAMDRVEIWEPTAGASTPRGRGGRSPTSTRTSRRS